MVGWMVGLSLILGCASAKQSTGFRQMKREADTLVVINPYVEINAFNFHEELPDQVLDEKDRGIITRTTREILAGRYALKDLDLPEPGRKGSWPFSTKQGKRPRLPGRLGGKTCGHH